MAPTNYEVANNLRWKKFNVLDQGHVCLVDHMGDDSSVVQAARVSYGNDIQFFDQIPEDVRTSLFETLELKKSETPSEELQNKIAVFNEFSRVRSLGDRKLIRYMMSHNHGTPFEMCEVKFRIRIPMDCWRQMVRHRTACLSGDTPLVFSRPCDGKPYRLTVKEVYDRFQPTQNLESSKQGNSYFKRDRVQEMGLRCVNEDTLELCKTKVVDVWQSGEKAVYEVTISSSSGTPRSIKTSEDHLFFTPDGWRKLKDLSVGSKVLTISSRKGIPSPKLNKIDPYTEEWSPIKGWEDYYEVSSQGRVRRIVGGRGSRSFGRCKKITVVNGTARVSLNSPGKQVVILISRAMLEAFDYPILDPECSKACHSDGNSLNNTLENLYWGSTKENAEDMVGHQRSTFLCSQPKEITSISLVGTEMTYDLEVSGPWHNFCANDFIVHNSINEYSTRYTEAIDARQTTAPSEWRLQSSSNKQGSDGFLDEEIGSLLSAREADHHDAADQLYKFRLKKGVAKEQARKDLPLSTYTELYWKCDLRNIFHFLKLRMDSHAQLEIRQYANAIAEIIKHLYPLSYEAFVDFSLEATTFSRLEILMLKSLLEKTKFSSLSEDFSTVVSELNFEDWKNPNSREAAECKSKLKLLGIEV